MRTATILKSASINGFGYELAEVRYSADGELCWEVRGYGVDNEFETEHDTLEEAEEDFARETEAERRLGRPNWAAQAAYDEQWGEPLYCPSASEY